MSIRVLLADDHQLMREGLRAVLDEQEDMEVVADVENGREAARLAKQLQPDVVVMDISMPDLNGIEAARRVASDAPEAKVIALSMHSDRQFVSEMLKAGAAGYVLKDCATDELLQAVRTVVGGHTYLSPRVARVVVEGYVRKAPHGEAPAAPALTDREREVLQLLAEGKTTKQIALALHVSAKTIETHRRNMMEKLDIHSVAELTKYALREGLTTLEA
jgi:DNA-binding NarL/FixJ family response regulator